ncbi:MAG: hypothetical protein HQL71_11915 [Magnetococcales bacterium]|nr:hypothetical protein [Magnetococcales bacterium]
MSRYLQGSNFKVFVIAAVMFTYGFSSGYFKIFPFQIIDNIHTAIIQTINPTNKVKSDKRQKKPKNNGTKQLSTPYYLTKLSTFKESKISPDYIIVGDSLIDGAPWHELLNGVSIINRGIAGDTTLGVLNRIQNSLALKPKKLFLMIGINDLKWGFIIKQSIDNYKKILVKIKNNNVQTTVFSVIYPGKLHQEKYFKKFGGDLQKRVQLFNKELKQECNKQGIKYLDINGSFVENGFLKKGFSYDGLHLNGLAYVKFAELLQNNL